MPAAFLLHQCFCRQLLKRQTAQAVRREEGVWECDGIGSPFVMGVLRPRIYIPLGVKPEAELFTGFGKKQLFQSIVGSLVMGGIAALAWFFTENVTTTVILALAGIFGSVMMTTKDQSNLSVVDQVQNLIRFLRGQKIYPYCYGDEWGLE